MGNGAVEQQRNIEDKKDRIRNFFEYSWLCVLRFSTALCIIGIIAVKS